VKSFKAISGGLLVAPILQTLILNRNPIETLDFADSVAKWDIERIIPGHLKVRDLYGVLVHFSLSQVNVTVLLHLFPFWSERLEKQWKGLSQGIFISRSGRCSSRFAPASPG
jgi:Domain of unknown function (DUF4336)